jgi:hypothetical protein
MKSIWNYLMKFLATIIGYCKIALKWLLKCSKALFRFIGNNTVLRIIGAIIIGATIYLKESLSKEHYPALAIVFPIIIGCLFLFFNPISDALKNLRERKKKRKEIEDQVRPALLVLKEKIGINLDHKLIIGLVESSDIDYEKKESILVFIINSIDSLSQKVKDALILCTLCHEIDTEVDILKSERYKAVITTIFEKYDFIDLDEGAKTILQYHENFKNNKKLDSEIPTFDFANKTNELTKQYSKTYNLSYKLKLEKDQSEEFRRTLAILIREGKLSVKQLEKDLKDRISDELKKKAVKSKAFLVLSNIFQRIPAVENVLNRFPHVKYSFPNPSRLPDNIKYVSTRIIYPSSSFQNAETFLKQEIRPLIPDDKLNDGFIAIIPIEGTEMYSIPEKSDDISKSHLKEGFESIAAYKTGLSLDLTELYIEAMKDEINVDEVLANIPFNIFVPGIPEKIKNFLIANYDNLKSKFNINRLSDWADINADDLQIYLVELDEERDKKRLHTDDNWGSVANKIVSRAIKHRDAMNS